MAWGDSSHGELDAVNVIMTFRMTEILGIKNGVVLEKTQSSLKTIGRVVGVDRLVQNGT